VQYNEIETSNINKELYIIKNENEFLIDESKKKEIEIISMQKDKQNIKAAIIFLVRNINKLKEQVKKEDTKTKEFVNEVSQLVGRHSPKTNRNI
jgi:hypothetical protein